MELEAISEAGVMWETWYRSLASTRGDVPLPQGDSEAFEETVHDLPH